MNGFVLNGWTLIKSHSSINMSNGSVPSKKILPNRSIRGKYNKNEKKKSTDSLWVSEVNTRSANIQISNLTYRVWKLTSHLELHLKEVYWGSWASGSVFLSIYWIEIPFHVRKLSQIYEYLEIVALSSYWIAATSFGLNTNILDINLINLILVLGILFYYGRSQRCGLLVDQEEKEWSAILVESRTMRLEPLSSRQPRHHFRHPIKRNPLLRGLNYQRSSLQCERCKYVAVEFRCHISCDR